MLYSKVLKDYHCDNPFCFTQYFDYTKRRLQLKFKKMKRKIGKADMLEPLTLDLPEDTYIDEEIIKDVLKIQQRLTKEYLSTIKKNTL